VSPYESVTEKPAAGPAAGWRPMTAAVVAVFMLMLDAAVVTVAVPGMRRDLHAGPGGLERVLNACALAVAAWFIRAAMTRAAGSGRARNDEDGAKHVRDVH
jgi:hypothetical protein